MIDGSGISQIVLIWMLLDFTDVQSTLVQVMACCLTAPSHYLSRCWPRSLSPHGVTRPQWVNLLHTEFCIFCHFSMMRWHWWLKSFPMEDKDMIILYNQYHGCWWPGDTRSQGISRHGIDLVCLEIFHCSHEKGWDKVWTLFRCYFTCYLLLGCIITSYLCYQ